ncbi:MAG TPA: hypothetical protein DD381_10835 [Lentisphaeria bacterium]|nr:MAG: hypothetical protein A2X47_00765 [Lentisphaerae bacterium GWF2_38_69]HBM16822.1 hypothetical protein [Lentisphaeria bacterium]
MKIQILNSAKEDLRDGYFFYERQTEGLGAYFLDSLYSDIDSLRLYAGIHQILYTKYHRMLSIRFPFAVYYQIAEDIVKIYAVLDCRKSPAWIRKKLI